LEYDRVGSNKYLHIRINEICNIYKVHIKYIIYIKYIIHISKSEFNKIFIGV